MSVGSNLQEMENVVTKGAKPAEPIQKLAGTTPGQAAVEDLGGPTPENYKVDDDSAKLKTPGASLKQVKDVVNKGAKAAEAVSDKLEDGQEVVAEEPAKEEETTVSEEETSTEEVVAESEESTEEVVAEAEETVEVSIDEDIEALISGEELSEEFQEKARTIFEAAIQAKASEISEQLTASYEEKLVEEVATIKQELSGRVDSYLEYVADEWMQENALAVENGLKTEMTESFLGGMKSLFEEHYVTIPEEKYDVIESMVDKLDEMEGKLNEQIEKNVALNRRLAESAADVIFAEVTEGLAQTQKDKIASLIENVEFESEDAYREKLVTLRESYFPSNTAQRDTSENLTEENGSADYQPIGASMEVYLNSLKRVVKK
tara:strand:- start:1291 stop:2418 length:1128 start_codon:yes stop_codon:yes gene_type:complete